VRLGGSLPRRVPTGEVAAVGSHDAERIGSAMEVLGRLAGALVSRGRGRAAARARPPRGAGRAGAPPPPAGSGRRCAVAPAAGPAPELVGQLRPVGADTVSGLRGCAASAAGRVLQPVRAASQEVRAAVWRGQGIAAGRGRGRAPASSWSRHWLGARLVVAGQVSVGELIAFYGYAVPGPARAHGDRGRRQVHPGAGRGPPGRECSPFSPSSSRIVGAGPPSGPPPGFPSERPGRGGRAAHRGVAAAPEGPRPTSQRFADGDGCAWVGRPARPAAGGRAAGCWSASTTRACSPGASATSSTDRCRAPGGCWPPSTPPRPATCWRLPDGLDSGGRAWAVVSGGQRQRLVLARALVADRSGLVEPTSAIDAHTGPSPTAGRRPPRPGLGGLHHQPLLLDPADTSRWWPAAGGGRGHHRDLLDTEPRYRAVVTRGEEP
jgi:hypothetical protein